MEANANNFIGSIDIYKKDTDTREKSGDRNKKDKKT